MNDLAPILLIAFNRPDHFNKTLFALCKNNLAKESKLIISIDGPKNKNDENAQKLIFKSIENASENFKSIHIIKNKKNKGLAINIVNSVSNILKEHKKIIVIEDDLITSKSFLKFMNDALDFYEDKKKIWHINGHNIINYHHKKNEIFLWRFMNCWGWATWEDRWLNFEKNPNRLINSFNKEMIFRFNLDGTCFFWDQVKKNQTGELNTWAIFWYATIFEKDGICVSPWFSYVKNIGFDGSGTNCKDNKLLNKQTELNNDGIFFGVDKDIEDIDALFLMKKAYKKSSIKKVITNMIKNLLGNDFYGKLRNLFKKVINSKYF